MRHAGSGTHERGMHSTFARASLPCWRSSRDGVPATESERRAASPPERRGAACHARPPCEPSWAALQRLWAGAGGPRGAAPATGAGGARRRRRARRARSAAARPACRARAAPRGTGGRRRAPGTHPAPARPAARRPLRRPPLERRKATRRPAGRHPASRRELPPPRWPRRRCPLLRARQRWAPPAPRRRRRAHDQSLRAAQPARTTPALPRRPPEPPGRAPGPRLCQALEMPARAPGPPAPAGQAGARACRATAPPAPAARAARRPPWRRPAAAAPCGPRAPSQAPRCRRTARRRAPGRAARAALSSATRAATLPQADDTGAGSPSARRVSTEQARALRTGSSSDRNSASAAALPASWAPAPPLGAALPQASPSQATGSPSPVTSWTTSGSCGSARSAAPRAVGVHTAWRPCVNDDPGRQKWYCSWPGMSSAIAACSSGTEGETPIAAAQRRTRCREPHHSIAGILILHTAV